MEKSLTKRLLLTFGCIIFFILAGIFYFSNSTSEVSEQLSSDKKSYDSQSETMGRTEKKAARRQYFFRLMRNPATNQIPPNIRNRELQFAKKLPSADQALRQAKAKNPSLQSIDYNWQQAGPFDLGGRTRALAVDQNNPNNVLAGGVSGGMWKSTDSGQSWQLTTPNLPNLSVTSIAQDPLNPSTWYYSSGEVISNSASAVGAPHYGQGIYESNDNGNSWTLMSQASSSNYDFVDEFNTVSRIRISPTTGTIFISSTGHGIYRSTDGQSFSNEPVLGTEDEQLYTDVAVASDGTVAAVISEASFDDQQSENSNSPNHNPGIFISNNDGQNQSWIEITPSTFPETHRRSVLSFAPSNPDILYVFTLKGAGDTSNQGVSFFQIDISDPQNPDPDNRSENLPDFRIENNDTGYINAQGGYNMLIDVKPDDEDYVFIGGTNLFRSSNAFASPPSGGYDGNNEDQKDEYWIGGYNQDNSAALYPNQHPDQHILEFPEPNTNPNLMLAGHDGGLSFTNDVNASEVSWENRDDGYVTSQFYAMDIPTEEDDNRLLGGTQDNGTPFFRYDNSQQADQTLDLSSGDGGYSFWGKNYAFVSSQNGTVLRLEIEPDGSLTSPFDGSTSTGWSNVHPSEAENQLFIHPYVVDPNDENVMYYPENNFIWRNTEIDQIPDFNSGGTTAGWEELQNINIGPEHIITAVEVSQDPANVLYFGGYNSEREPELRRLNDAKSATSGMVDIPLPSNSPEGNDLSGAYIKDIAINPINGNEVIVVLSNYNIVGLYHTTDGGDNWQPIEGNLTGTSSNPGISLRSATMIPAESGTIYFVATSTGIYSTQMLDDNNTTWGQEAAGNIGNAVTEDLASRISDGDVVAATHGRGSFLGDFQGTTSAPSIIAEPAEGPPDDTITLTADDFEFNPDPADNTVTFGDVQAIVQSATSSQLIVEIPRDVLDRQESDRSVTITVETGEQSVFTNFTVLPPQNFTLNPNYPNPFNPSTTISFDVPSDSRVSLVIYNMSGKKVLEPIYQEQYNAGTYDQQVNLSNLASGVYIYRIVAETGAGETLMESKKMTLIK